MKDIPIFSTENGIASLILKDIPYTKTAYIKFCSAIDFDLLLDECIAFCTLAGAETVIASGDDRLNAFPLHTIIQRMCCTRKAFPTSDLSLVPVTGETLNEWLTIYRSKTERLPNAAYLSELDGKKMLLRGDSFFIYDGKLLLGIGMASGETIHFLASLHPGSGERIVSALNSVLTGCMIELDVSTDNRKALQLYEKLGFQKAGEDKVWYKILDCQAKVLDKR